MTDERAVTNAELVTIREHLEVQLRAEIKRIDQRISDGERLATAALENAREAVAAALASSKEAVTKAEAASEKRFEGINEFRASLADVTRLQLPRVEAETRFIALADRINAVDVKLTEKHDVLAARVERDPRFFSLDENLRRLAARVDTAEGASRGIEKSWGVLVAVAGVVTGIVAVGLTLFLTGGSADDGTPTQTTIENVEQQNLRATPAPQ